MGVDAKETHAALRPQVAGYGRHYPRLPSLRFVKFCANHETHRVSISTTKLKTRPFIKSSRGRRDARLQTTGFRPPASGGRARPCTSLSECCLPPPIHPPSRLLSTDCACRACSGCPSSWRTAEEVPTHAQHGSGFCLLPLVTRVAAAAARKATGEYARPDGAAPRDFPTWDGVQGV